MTYFLLQQRYLKPEGGDESTYPARLSASITFGPEDAFGITTSTPPPRTTAKQARPARAHWNANEGTSRWEAELIEPLAAELGLGQLTAVWSGNKLKISLPVASKDQAENIIISLNQILPAFLSLRLRVFVWIKEYVAEVGSRRFRIEIGTLRFGIVIATSEKNSEGASQSTRDSLQLKSESLRLLMALYYYRHALRLASIEPDRESMAAEVILNLSKSIEILFSSDREQLRRRARGWGFEDAFIERWVVPILLIRNELDVAHVTSAPISADQHQAILNFMARAFEHVHSLLQKVAEKAQAGQITLPPRSEDMDTDKEKLLKKIKEYADAP